MDADYVPTTSVVVDDAEFDAELREASSSRRRTHTLDEGTHPWEKERARTVALSVSSNAGSSAPSNQEAFGSAARSAGLGTSPFVLTPETAAIPIMSDEDYESMMKAQQQNRRRSSTLQESTHPWEKERALRAAMEAVSLLMDDEPAEEGAGGVPEGSPGDMMDDAAFDRMIQEANKGRRRSSTLREDTHPWEKEKAMDAFKQLEGGDGSSGTPPSGGGGGSSAPRKNNRRPSGTGLPAAGARLNLGSSDAQHSPNTPVTPEMFSPSVQTRERSTTVYGGETHEARVASVVARAHGEDVLYVKTVPRAQHSNIDCMLDDTSIHRVGATADEVCELPDVVSPRREPEQPSIVEDDDE